MTDETISILIADDHAVVRQGLRALIDTEPGMILVGEAQDGIEAVLKARALHPDVILLDMVMPRQGGLETIKQIKVEWPDTRILVLTSFAEDEKVFPAIKAGALGYILKDSSPGQLLQAIRDVYRGESSLHPTIARKLILELNQEPEQPLTEDPLTEREVDVLQQLAQGLSNQQIAENLVLSERTVRAHVSHILDKLHIANRTQAALYALRKGISNLEAD
ncbi:response regulator [Aggregatilinea lenta]|uniref:response regulator n=1 Tax=Aggregatilinea lenta TaxID=913108 RepID=UPI001EE89869|nr:response regulator transcription factor [Aggregatilinea lenta]